MVPKIKITKSFYDTKTANRRLRELILYVAHRCQDDINYGAIKLNKILYFADFQSYVRLGKPITGSEYMKLTHGPVPRQMKPVLDGMIRDQELVCQQRDRFGKLQHRYIPLRCPDLDDFKASEISLVDEIIEEARPYNGAELSSISHNRAWRIADERATIPYEAAYLSDEPVTELDIQLTKLLFDRRYEAKRDGPNRTLARSRSGVREGI